MGSSALTAGLRHLRCRLAVQQRSGESDEQLLHDFTTRRDDSAFAVIVHRHGPMVLRICRHVLGHEQDAEDAFQGTFLVLAQSAASLRRKTSLVSWLHGTAFRTALKAKQSAVRRRKHEDQTPARLAENPSEELLWREVRTLLDEEIARLPEIYRNVFILCCLEGLNQTEVGRRLGLKVRTVSNRLAEARKRLGQRLARRGVELTAVLAAVTVAAQPTSAVPAVLMASTIEAALAMAAGEGLASVVSASVADLVKSVTAAMMASKAKMATLSLLAVALVGSASAWVTESRMDKEPGERGRVSAPSESLGALTRPRSPEAAKGMEIQGRVLDPEGKPKAGAKLLLLSHGANRKVAPLGVSAADGHFTVVVPQVKEDESMPTLIAQADGVGLDFFDLSQSKSGKPVELHLVKDRAINGRVVNTEGKPVAGARVTVENLGIGPNKSLDAFLIEWKKKPFNAALPFGIQLMTDLDDERGKAALFDAVTDADGRFVLRGLGEERFVCLHLSGGGVADENVWIINRRDFDPKPYNQATLDKIPKEMEAIAQKRMLHGSDVSVVAEAEKIIRGIVKDTDSGEVRPNMVIRLIRAVDRMVLQATTDAQGRYQIRGARKAKSYALNVLGDAMAGYVQRRFVAPDTAGYQPITADITVKKGVIITGKMIDRLTRKPLRGFVETAVLVGNPFANDYPPFDISGWFLKRDTDAGGNFRVVALPGPVLLMGGPRELKAIRQFKRITPDPKYPRYFDTSFSPDLPAYINFDSSIFPLEGNFCKVLEIEPDAKIVEQDIVLERSSVLPVRIEDADGQPLRGAWCSGNIPRHYLAMQCEEAACSAYQVEPGKPRLLAFFHPARKLAGTLTLKGGEKPSVSVKLAPAGAVKGRLLDTEGKPLAGVVVEPMYRDRQADGVERMIHEARQIVTDANGAFLLDELIPQLRFDLSLRRGKQLFEREKKAEETIQVKPGECRDLGAIRAKRVIEKSDE